MSAAYGVILMWKNIMAISTLAVASLVGSVTIGFEKGKDDTFTFLNDSYASIIADGALSGSASLRIDTRKSTSVWNPGFATAQGLLKADTEYVISFTCRILEAEKDAFVHALIRPLDTPNEKLDAERLNFTDIGIVKKLKMKFRTKDNNTYALQIHTRNKVLCLIDDIVITEGTGETFTGITAGSSYTKPLSTATGSADFTIDMPARAEKTVSVADFGASPALSDNRRQFADAIAFCASNRIGRLIVPRGVYRFTDNNPIRFEGLTNFEFDAQGSEFIWRKERGTLVEIHTCERVLFRNFFIDWDWEKDPVGSIVKATAVDLNAPSIDLEFVDHTRFPRRDMRIGILEALDPATMSVGYENGFTIGFEFYKGRADTPPAKYEWLSDNSIRLYGVSSDQKYKMTAFVKPGVLFRIRHYVYDMVGISMGNNTHLTLSNVTVYSCPSHAYHSFGEQHHWQFLNTHIIRRPGTKRPLTCSADHHHISQSQGFFKMDGCEFSLGGDDCLNVHDTTGFAFKTGERTLKTKNYDPGSLRVGDTVELRNDDYSPTGHITKLAEKKGAGGRNGVYDLTFEDALPEQKGTGFILFNKRYGSRNIIIRNSYFHDNKARGLLILANDVTIEHNRFFHNEMGAIKIETGYTFNVWSEGYGASNIVIRNNKFENVNPIGAYVNEKQPVIYMSVYLKSDPSVEKTLYPILNTILVEKNEFINNPGVIAYVCSAGNVVIRENVIRNTVPRIEMQKYRGAVGVSHAGDVKIINNTWVRTSHAPRPGVFTDDETTRDIEIEGNTIVDK